MQNDILKQKIYETLKQVYYPLHKNDEPIKDTDLLLLDRCDMFYFVALLEENLAADFSHLNHQKFETVGDLTNEIIENGAFYGLSTPRIKIHKRKPTFSFNNRQKE